MSKFLVWSLGLNLVLAITLLATGRNRSVVTLKTPTKTTTDAISNSYGEVSLTNSTFSWSMIDSGDLRRLVSNLRAAGCPETTVGDIIVAKVEKRYADQSRALSSPPIPPPWENAEYRRDDETACLAKLSDMGKGKRAFVKELLGYDRDDHLNRVWNDDLFTSSFLGFLPDTAVSQLMAIYDSYSTKAKVIKIRANDILIDEDRENLDKLYDGLIAEVSGMLTPDEMEELELRVQAGIFLTANNIHWDGVEITGSELREYVRLSRTCNDAFQNQFLGINPSQNDLELKETEFAREVEALLGQLRFVDYQRAQDFDFREIHEFTEERNFPSATAITIYNARVTMEDQADQIKRDNSLSPTEQTEAMAVLKVATTEIISPALGNSYGDYLNSQGQWLQSLSSNPTTTIK